MTRISKFKCPECKHTIENWHRSYIAIGFPFIRCENCNTVVKKPNIDEWEAMSWLKTQYYLIFYIQAPLYTIPAVVFAGLLIDKIFKVEFSFTPLYLFLVVVLSIVSIVIRHIKFQKLIQRSKERTKDFEYRKMLGLDKQ